MNQSKLAPGLWVGLAERGPSWAANRWDMGGGSAGGHLGETLAEDGSNPGTNSLRAESKDQG